ncbi:cation diffusion facilitator family transporter [Alkalimarinus sediminis]|uniref:Cation diffusion facilitator family transporter n=1 Tax=Alkalimarinus sediminis TaxID=1632866 RepID=A0A9E8KJD0_9ALTE|nr:cation diffusion facilitator family transporter [Alkalimarinus sediminis]UZW74901.1 cation diffusion facilitator family transporter [Alkalimarinus sediminis]
MHSHAKSGHSHAHTHAHAHGHAHAASGRMGVAFFLNLFFTIIEFIGGWLTNSTAIMADAVHDLGDTLSIGLGWLLGKMGDKGADNAFSYGYRRLSLLGALVNGAVLVAGSTWVLFEAVPRLANPEMPHAQGMFGLAILGVVVNGYAAYKLSDGKTLNERVLNWHLMEDVLGWVAVLIVSVVLMFVDWPILDPLLSIAFTLFILINVMRTLKETVKLFLQATPDQALREKIYQQLLALEQVAEVHHFHLWSLDGESHVLTAHLVLSQPLDNGLQAAVKLDLAKGLEPYRIAHTTIEFEQPEESCRDSY